MYTSTNLLSLFCTICLFALSSQAVSANCTYERTIEGEVLSVGVMISWSTIAEEENAMFIIERSEDGVRYNNIGAVKGAGDSESSKSYSFLDNSKATGQRYYRLRQIDFSGIFTVSPVLILDNQKEKLFSISSMDTPSTADRLEVKFDSTQPAIFEFELSDIQGKSLLIEHIEAKQGANTLKLDLKHYEDTAYKLTLRTIEEEQTVTFKKVKPARGR